MMICVVGLGYVGLPLAVAFGRKQAVIGFDVNEERVAELKDNIDSTHETTTKELQNAKIKFSTDQSVISKSDFIIVAVPTPILDNKKPDLSYIRSASELVGKNLSKDAIVVYESTVYPGVTEEECVPILEKESGLEYKTDFFVGYSPERINPGDSHHTVEKIMKVVSGCDKKTTDSIAEVYGSIITAGIHKAPNIKTAEAAKVIENIQRDLNIALMNELSIIFGKMGISTNDVIAAAKTKWNFHDYHPGLVGGHCIGIDPYYLTYKAQLLGYQPRVILGGREINEYMPIHVMKLTEDALITAGKNLKGSKILVMGITFKENVPDMRNSKVADVIMYLQESGAKVFSYDPVVLEDRLPTEPINAVIVAVPHKEILALGLDKIKDLCNGIPILIDIRGVFSKNQAEDLGFIYRCL